MESYPCPVCCGDGALRSLDPHEEERGINDTCYHCAGSGVIDAESYRHDKLIGVAETLATMRATELRRLRDEDPEGEGFAFAAAENMMTPHEYFIAVREGICDRYIQELLEMTAEEQDLLIAWNDAA